MLIMSRLVFLALVPFAHWVNAETTTESGKCEDYGEKVKEGWETSTLARDDPCFGYGYSCCTETYSDYCYWKDTYNCHNCELDIGYGGCNACCDSYDNTESPTNVPTFDPSKSPTEDPTPAPVTPAPETTVVTDSPTLHSAKKWETLHPAYKGGDGELLWNIYYGDFSDDERFDSFRADQLWDADVIRPIIEADNKYQRFQLVNVAVNHSRSVEAKRHWSSLTMTIIFVSLMAITALALVFWYKHSEYEKIADSTEKQALLQK